MIHHTYFIAATIVTINVVPHSKMIGSTVTRRKRSNGPAGCLVPPCGAVNRQIRIKPRKQAKDQGAIGCAQRLLKTEKEVY